MATYTIHDTSLRVKYLANSDDYIFRSAERAGYHYSIGDGAGASLASLAYAYEGTVDNYDQSFLSQNALDAGFFLLNTAYPESDLKIVTDEVSVMFMYQNFLNNPFTFQPVVEF
ncbi:MAG TPA: hypothetical protein VJS14_16725 [Enterobacteriaceae bacterium]|nr:hypothetical protein [Enterobacteriaceae bacterium]